MNEDQVDELEALKSIFEEEFEEISRMPPCFMIRIPSLETITTPLHLKVTFSLDYPNAVPELQIPLRTAVLSNQQMSQLMEHLKQIADDNLNSAMVYILIDEATQWLNANVTTDNLQTTEAVKDNIPDEDVSAIRLTESKHTGGKWNYVIGLVVSNFFKRFPWLRFRGHWCSGRASASGTKGKPSAGKSTFFNACTRLDLAKTGAHPFTTIEPNIGKAFYSVPCPCQSLKQTCNAEYGHAFNGERYVPVLLKDVAGLVPGASEGKGKGNRFLNDLLDADVLIHIIDVSGRTNEKGEETTEYDPYNDVRWLQEELHQWIYQNVYSKWENIIKHPKKLVEMFTGYHANKTTIHAAFRSAGVDGKELSAIASWKENTLHKIVESFLNIRFPMFLALNKADLEGSPANIKDTTIPVCSMVECSLQQIHQDNAIQYLRGDNKFDVLKTGQEPLTEKNLQLALNVLDEFKSTNVHKALSMAVGLKSPVYAFPVCDLENLRSIKRGHVQGHLEVDVLRDCIPLKPGTTVEDLHKIMMYDQIKLLKGEFVRAEVYDKNLEKRRPAKKDEVITPANCLIHIMTNRKSFT